MIYATEQQVVVTSVAIVTVAIVALFVGIIYGRRRGLEEAAEEQQWAREQANSRLPARGDTLDAGKHVVNPGRVPPEVAHEAWLAHEEQALALASETAPPETWLARQPDILEPTVVINPGEESTTAWTRRMAADMDAFLRGLIGGTPQA